MHHCTDPGDILHMTVLGEEDRGMVWMLMLL